MKMSSAHGSYLQFMDGVGQAGVIADVTGGTSEIGPLGTVFLHHMFAPA
jgi:hypothetical protein